jgi:hypothetical protein
MMLVKIVWDSLFIEMSTVAPQSSGLQLGVCEDILGGTQKHLTGYVNLKKNL